MLLVFYLDNTNNICVHIYNTNVVCLDRQINTVCIHRQVIAVCLCVYIYIHIYLYMPKLSTSRM